MKYFYFLLIFFVYLNPIFAHEANEAFFKFTIKDDVIEVEAEFPWTMRNALIEFNPSLKNSIKTKDFENTFIEYIKKNLVLKDRNGKSLQFKAFKALANNGHSHQNNYLISFSGSDILEITNTIMFNLYENQINYNKINFESESLTFQTNKSSKKINLRNPHKFDYSWYLLLLLTPILYLIYKLFKKKKIVK